MLEQREVLGDVIAKDLVDCGATEGDITNEKKSRFIEYFCGRNVGISLMTCFPYRRIHKKHGPHQLGEPNTRSSGLTPTIRFDNDRIHNEKMSSKYVGAVAG